MSKIKILILNKKERLYIPNRTIDKIIQKLKEQSNVEIFWILSDSGQYIESLKHLPPRNIQFKFFEDYKTDNVVNILKIEKPDVILTSNDFDFWSRSFLIAAKYLNIPVVLLMQFLFDYAKEQKNHIIKGRLNHLTNNARFLVSKYLLLLKTYRYTNHSMISILKKLLGDAHATFTEFEPSGKYGCDLILVNNESLSKTIQKYNTTSKIIVTGDPQLDDLLLNYTQNKNKQLKSIKKIVFLTTSMVEHGLWDKSMWEETIIRTIKFFEKNFSNKINLILKIHPSSEKRDDYQKLFSKYGINYPIFQSENLVHILSDTDLVLAFGDTWALWDALLMNKPIIMINFVKYPINMIPFLNAGVVFEATNENELLKLISNSDKLSVDESKKEIFLKQYLYKLDGKSSERSAKAILNLIKN